MKTEKFQTMVVAKEAKVNKEGQPYGVVTIMDGSNPLNIVTKDDVLYNSVEVFKVHDVVLDIKFGKYPKAEFLSIEVA